MEINSEIIILKNQNTENQKVLSVNSELMAAVLAKKASQIVSSQLIDSEDMDLEEQDITEQVLQVYYQTHPGMGAKSMMNADILKQIATQILSADPTIKNFNIQVETVIRDGIGSVNPFGPVKFKVFATYTPI